MTADEIIYFKSKRAGMAFKMTTSLGLRLDLEKKIPYSENEKEKPVKSIISTAGSQVSSNAVLGRFSNTYIFDVTNVKMFRS